MPFVHGHALIIGVDAYADMAFESIPQVGTDARTLREVLVDPALCAYPPAQVTALTSTAASRAQILAALDALAQRATADDTVVISYTGHGVFGSGNRGYFLTAADSRVDDLGAIVPTSGISDTTLLGALRAIRAGKLLVILNACHSGHAAALGTGTAATRGAVPPDDRVAAILGSGSGRAVISACQAGERSWSLTTDPHTLFGDALLAGLRGEGTDNQRHPDYVGLFDLFVAITDRLNHAVPRRIGRGTHQQPVLTVLQQSGPFPVAMYAGAQTLSSFDSAAAIPDSDDLAIAQVSPAAAKRAFERLAPVVTTTTTTYTNTNQSGGVSLPGAQIGTVGEIIGGDKITTGNVSGAGNAIGRGARSITTGGGDYAGRDIDKRSGTFVRGDQFTMSGNFTGAILTIKSTLRNVTQTIGAAPSGDATTKVQLQALIEQLSAELAKVPADKASDAEAVAQTAKAAVEQATAAQPNATMVRITGDGLKAAAQNIAATLPTVLPIATQIANALHKLVGG